MVSYTWHPQKLDQHYHDHPCSTDEYSCWAKLSGNARAPISKKQYEDQSIETITNAWLVIDAGYQEKTYSEVQEVTNFYDRRACFTAVSRGSKRIRTCFHLHLQGDCDTQDSLRRKLLLVNKLIDKRDSTRGRLISPKVLKHDVAPSERRRLADLFRILTHPRRTGSMR